MSGKPSVIARHGHQAAMPVTIDLASRLGAAEEPSLADFLFPIPTDIDLERETVQLRPAGL